MAAVAAQIVLDLLPNGNVQVRWTGPAAIAVSLLGMLESAKLQVHDHFTKAAAAGPAVAVAGPQLAKLLNGRGG